MSWPRQKLELLAANMPYSLIGGPFGSKLTSRDYVDYGVPVVRGSNLSNGRFLDMDDFVFVSDSKVRKDLSSNLAKPGDLVFTQRGTLGQVAIIPEEGISDRYVVSQSQMKLTVDGTKADKLFLYYYFTCREAVERIMNFTSSSGVPHINLTVLRNFEVPVPPLETQTAIATILSAYDSLIENNRRRIQLLELAARLLYKEWFVHLRFPGHEHVEIMDGVPEGWRIAALQEVCERITDGAHHSPKSVDDGLAMASVKDMRDWGFKLDRCRRIAVDDYEKLVRADCKPLKNDVLIAKDGSYLKHTFVVQEEMDLVILSSIAILRPNAQIDPHLLNFILRDPQTKNRMAGYVSGVALPRIILREFRKFQILVPSESVQHFWAEHVHPIAEQCHTLGKQNEALSIARDILLPRLMSGKIAV